MSHRKDEPKPIRVGVFNSVAAAESAFQSLTDAKFTSDEITVFCSNDWQQKHFPENVAEVEEPESPQAATAGGAIGAILGGLGAAAGLATVAGIPVLVAGTLGGSLAGGVVGTLTGVMAERGVEKEDADYFDQAVTDGKMLISVEPANHEPERLALAAKILRDAGSEPISLLEG